MRITKQEKNNTRAYTNKLIEGIDFELFDAQEMARALLMWISEEDAEKFAKYYEYIEEEEEEEEETEKFAIVHHSEMTDINVYFISEDKKNLIKNKSNINNYISADNEKEWERMAIILQKNKITPINDEYIDDEKILKNITIIEMHSYRF